MAEEDVIPGSDSAATLPAGDSDATASAAGDGAAGADISTEGQAANSGPIDLEKLDYETMSPSEIRDAVKKHAEALDKKWQADFTRNRQKDKEELAKIKDKADFFDKMLQDKEVYNFLEGRLSGKNASKPSAEEASDLDNVDPVLRSKLQEYDAKLKLLEDDRRQAQLEKAESEIKSFRSELKTPEKMKDFDDMEGDIVRIVEKLKGSGFTMREKLDVAYSTLTRRKVFEEGKRAAWDTLEKKKAKVAPENPSSPTGVTPSGKKLSFEDAVKIAERELSSQK